MTTNHLDAAGASATIAQRAMQALADGDQAAALAALEDARDKDEAVGASSYLLACLWQAVLVATNGNKHRASHTLREAAGHVPQDAVLHQVRLILNATAGDR